MSFGYVKWIKDILKSYSVVNSFIFIPPRPPRYDETSFTHFENSNENQTSSFVSVSLVFVPRVVLASSCSPGVSVPIFEALPPSAADPPIPCLYFRVPNSRGLVVFFHGNACDIGTSAQGPGMYAQVCRVSVLVVEYPGYGLCPGEPTEASVQLVVESIVHFLLGRSERGRVAALLPRQIIVMGQSVGSGAAVHAVSTMVKTFGGSPNSAAAIPGAIVLKSGFASVKNAISDLEEFRSSPSGEAKDEVPLAAHSREDSEESDHEPTVMPTIEHNNANATPHPARSGPILSGGSGGDHHLRLDERPLQRLATFRPREIPWLFRVAKFLIFDRFENAKIIESLRVDLFCGDPKCPLLLVHGIADRVIPFHHSVVLFNAATGAPRRNWLDLKEAPHGSAGVKLALVDRATHNFLPIDVVESFCSTLELHSNDVVAQAPGTVDPLCDGAFTLVAAKEALEAIAAARQSAMRWFVFMLILLLIGVLCTLTLGVIHVSWCRSSGNFFDQRVAAWMFGETVGLILLGACSLLSRCYGLASETPKLQFVVFDLLVAISINVFSIGVLPVWIFRSVEWGSHSEGAALQLCKEVPHRFMQAFFGLHILLALWAIARNK